MSSLATLLTPQGTPQRAVSHSYMRQHVYVTAATMQPSKQPHGNLGTLLAPHEGQCGVVVGHSQSQQPHSHLSAVDAKGPDSPGSHRARPVTRSWCTATHSGITSTSQPSSATRTRSVPPVARLASQLKRASPPTCPHHPARVRGTAELAPLLRPCTGQRRSAHVGVRKPLTAMRTPPASATHAPTAPRHARPCHLRA